MASMVDNTKTIWVDASALPGGNGTPERPFNTIQAAANVALPGATIAVKAGEYHENVSLPRKFSGTDDKPITIVSIDGPQKAHIIAPLDTKPAIGGGGTEHVTIDGFWITGGSNGIQLSQNGYDFSDMVSDLVVKNNYVDGFAKDGIKINGGDNIAVLNNQVTGGKDNGIDFMSITNGVISNNEVSDSKGTSAGIVVKGGSSVVKISDNYVHDVMSDGISVGGWTDIGYVFREGTTVGQASKVLVENNRVEDVGKRPLSFYGAVDSVARNNYLEATDKYYTVVLVGNSNETLYGVFNSSNIKVYDNNVTRTTQTLFIESGSGGVAFENNAVASVKMTGAGSALNFDAEKAAPVPVEIPAAPVVVPTPPVVVVPDPVVTTIFDGKGTSGANVLRETGKAVAGGAGDDIYTVIKNNSPIVEKAGEGTDTVELYAQHHVLAANVENIKLMSNASSVLIGNGAANKMMGNVGNDFIMGGGGADVMTGGGGKDVFFIDDSSTTTQITDFAKGDVISIAANPFASFAQMQAAMSTQQGDTIVKLPDGRVIAIKGVDAASLTADDFSFGTNAKAVQGGFVATKVNAVAYNHVATGTAAGESIYGIGDGVLIGGAGDDTYFIQKSGDHIYETGNGGIDQALVTVSRYALDANVENAVVKTAAGASLIGNNMANILTGSTGADFLTGGAGADRLTGGAGKDVFAYAQAGDGGDMITDFLYKTDRIDVSTLVDSHAGTKFAFTDTTAGVRLDAIYADGHVEALATLANVHGVIGQDALIF